MAQESLEQVYVNRITGDLVLLKSEPFKICPYFFTQDTASKVWTINHNSRSITLTSQVFVNSELVEPNEITIKNQNTILLKFSTPVAGFATLLVFKNNSDECGVLTSG